MSNAPLMPKATAVWLVDNTSLTFEQIAEFCGLHTLEVKGIADGDVAGGIKGMDPIASGQLTRAEIDRGQDNPKYKLKISVHKVVGLPASKKKKKGPRYTPVSRRQDRPNAILWLLKNHPELTENEIIRLLGTTKNTIQAIAGGTHWNATHLQPVDPVTLALCTQTDLDAMVSKAGLRAKKEREAAGLPEETEATLMSASETTAHLSPDTIESATEALPEGWAEKPETKEPEEDIPTAESVFGTSDNTQSEAEAEEEALDAQAMQALASLNEKSEDSDNATSAQSDEEDKNAGYKTNVQAVCAAYSPDIVDQIVKYLGIALRTSKDAATVACSDKSELDRIRNGFMRKKLELDGSDEELDAAMKEVCERMGSSNRSKCRVAFYYLLVEKFNKQSLFG